MRLKRLRKRKFLQSLIAQKHISKQKQKRQHFYTLKKHLKGRKYISEQKQKRQHFYALKNV